MWRKEKWQSPRELTGRIFILVQFIEFINRFEKKQRELAPVIQKLDNTTHWMNHYPVDKYYGKPIIHWVVIYPVDSVFHLSNNWALEIKDLLSNRIRNLRQPSQNEEALVCKIFNVYQSFELSLGLS